MTATSVIFITRFILPVLAIWVICRCLRSMLSEKYEPETWGHLIFPDTSAAPLPHWECLIGRSKTADIVVNSADISRLHAVLIRNDKGVWRIYDMATRGGVFVNGERVPFKGLIVQNGDRIRLSSVTLGFADLTESELRTISDHRTSAGAFINPGATLLILSLFQALVALQYSFTASDTYLTVTCLSFFALLAIEWACYLIMRSVRRTGFEVETLAVFLCTLGLSVVATSEPEELVKTVILTMVGVVLFFLMGWWLRDLRRAKFLRWPATVAAVGLLCINLVLSEYVFGAKNWLYIGGFSLQPSELVKVLYIYAGAASLDRLFARRNLLLFIGFSALCVIALALMGDYGAAMIFFVTFLVISYMRSGSIATVFLAVSGAAMAGFLVFTIKPYIAQRFATWGHVWADPYGAGYQQTRTLAAAASGGLFGHGAGQGWLKNIVAANTDMVFGVICEEFGLLIAVSAVLSILILALFAFRSAAHGRSTYYVIAACAAASLMVAQLSLNVFGSLDILPFTGVTFPFVSKGGTSLLSCWMLLAFIKAADTRKNASFVVKSADSQFKRNKNQGAEA